MTMEKPPGDRSDNERFNPSERDLASQQLPAQVASQISDTQINREGFYPIELALMCSGEPWTPLGSRDKVHAHFLRCVERVHALARQQSSKPAVASNSGAPIRPSYIVQDRPEIQTVSEHSQVPPEAATGEDCCAAASPGGRIILTEVTKVKALARYGWIATPTTTPARADSYCSALSRRNQGLSSQPRRHP